MQRTYSAHAVHMQYMQCNMQYNMQCNLQCNMQPLVLAAAASDA